MLYHLIMLGTSLSKRVVIFFADFLTKVSNRKRKAPAPKDMKKDIKKKKKEVAEDSDEDDFVSDMCDPSIIK